MKTYLEYQMEATLKYARKRYGKVLTELEDVKIRGSNWFKENLNIDLLGEYEMSSAYVIDHTWHGDLIGLLIEWCTDYDFKSGIFVELDADSIATIKAIDDLEKDIDSLEWSHQDAVLRIAEWLLTQRGFEVPYTGDLGIKSTYMGNSVEFNMEQVEEIASSY